MNILKLYLNIAKVYLTSTKKTKQNKKNRSNVFNVENYQ